MKWIEEFPESLLSERIRQLQGILLNEDCKRESGYETDVIMIDRTTTELIIIDSVLAMLKGDNLIKRFKDEV